MPVNINVVSENGEVTKPLMEPKNNTTIEMTPLEIDKRTRFQVNKVNSHSDDPNESSNIHITVGEDDDQDEEGIDEHLLSANDRTRLNSDTASNNDTKYAKSFR